MQLVIFDTEFTAWPGSQQRHWSEPWEHRELIQLAAVKVEISDNGAHIRESFNELIVPTINPRLSDYIVGLTGIDQTMIDNLGIDFPSALSQFADFCQSFQLPCFSWGNDADVIRENCALCSLAIPALCNNAYDLQKLARSHDLPQAQRSSGELAAVLGVQLQGHNHNALFDVRSIVAALDIWLQGGALTLADFTTSALRSVRYDL